MKLARKAQLTIIAVYFALMGTAILLDSKSWGAPAFMYGLATGWLMGAAVMQALYSKTIRSLLRARDVVIFDRFPKS